jgi:hypothetical protein
MIRPSPRGRDAAIVMKKNRALELIGEVRDQLRCRFLELRRFLEQLAQCVNAKVFQLGECKAPTTSSQAEQALYLQ